MSHLIFGYRYPEIRLADLSEGNSHRLQAFRKKLLPRWTIADLNVVVTRILTPVQIQEQHSDMRCFMLVCMRPLTHKATSSQLQRLRDGRLLDRYK